MKLWLLVMLLGWAPLCYGQVSCIALDSLANVAVLRNDYSLAESYFQQAGDCFLSAEQYSEYFYCYANRLDCIHKNLNTRKFSREIQRLSSQFDSLQKHLDPQTIASLSLTLLQFRSILANIYGDSDKALTILTEALDSIETIPSNEQVLNDSLRIVKLNIYLAQQYLEQGNYQMVISCSNSALKIAAYYPDIYLRSGVSVRIHENLVRAYQQLGEPDMQLYHLRQIMAMMPVVEQRAEERQVQALLSMAEYFVNNSEPDSAEVYLNRAGNLDRSGRYAIDVLEMYGDVAGERDEYKSAAEYYNKALGKARNTMDRSGPAVARLYSKLAKVAMRSKNHRKAALLAHAGMFSMADAAFSDDIYVNPEPGELYPSSELSELIATKAGALLRMHADADSTAHLEAAWRSIRIGLEYLNRLRSAYSSANDKSVLISNSYRIFETALDIVYVKYNNTGDDRWVDTAFTIVEQSKALNMFESIMHDEARSFGEIPDSLIRLENEIRREIASLEGVIDQRKSGSIGEGTELIEYQGRLANRMAEYDSLVAYYSSEYPEYYSFVHSLAAPDILELRNKLGNDHLFLDYFLGEEGAFIIGIEKSRKSFIRAVSAERIIESIIAYRQSLFAYRKTKSSKSSKEYLQASTNLYEYLLEPFGTLPKEIIVAPDGPLGLVSFAALVKGRDVDVHDPPNWEYLVWDHNFTYANSAAIFLLVSDRSAVDRRKALLACAPVFDSDAEVDALKTAMEEVRAIRNIVGGDKRIGDACDLDFFVNEFSEHSDYEILHLATHGRADPAAGENSFLYLNGVSGTAKLYARDLSVLNMDASLIYLSACETGSGEIVRGEGVISLARAFFLAGAASLVTTLWTVNDRQSLELSKRFYRHLKKGSPKHAAVAQAQREYLKALHPEQRIYGHPVYWSAFTHNGSTRALKLKKSPGKAIYVVLAALVIAVVIVYRKKTQRRGNNF